MNLQFISWDDLNAIKENLDQYVSKFAQPSNAWIEEELGHSPFLNTKYPMPDIHLDMSQPMDKAYLTDAANVQEFYGKLSFISDSQASDERLWAGLCLGPFYEYTQYRWKIALHRFYHRTPLIPCNQLYGHQDIDASTCDSVCRFCVHRDCFLRLQRFQISLSA